MNQDLKLKDYDIKPNSTIYLLVILYAIPEDYDQLFFYLAHGYPENRKDFLDASVLLYSGSECKDVIDWKNRESKSCWAAKHCGDRTDNIEQMGYHTIQVSVKEIPEKINLLVFTLSAWSCKSISAYPNIRFKLVDKRCPDKTLCDDTIDDVVSSKAIIMCYLFNQDGKWNIISVKRPSDGCAMDYDAMKKNISECEFFKELAADHENKKTGHCVIS